MASMVAFTDELEKVGGRAGLKIIQRLLKNPTAANTAKAERLALTPGVLKKTRYGSEYAKDLGAGSEGVASRVVHHKKGITTRKLFNPSDEDQYAMLARDKRIPGGISSKEAIRQKEKFNKAMEGHSALPMQRGSAKTPSGHKMHFTDEVKGEELAGKLKKLQDEYGKESLLRAKIKPVKGRLVAPATPRMRELGDEFDKLQAIPKMHPQMRHLQLAAKQKGYKVGDLHEGNIIITPKGKPVVIDTVPMKKGQDFDDMVDKNRLNQMNYLGPRRATGAEIKQRAFEKRLPKESDFAHTPTTIAERKKALKKSRKQEPIPFPAEPVPASTAPRQVFQNKQEPPKGIFDRMKDWFRNRAA
jgi:hypothetical protein